MNIPTNRKRRTMPFIGEKHNKLTIISINGGKIICQCDCGKTIETKTFKLRSGYPNSCDDCYNNSCVKHGESGKTIEYRTWVSIKSIFSNPKTNRYYLYGGKRKKVCDRSLNSYENFLEDMGRRPLGRYSIDRIDSNGDYSKENCRWVGYDVQNKNRTVPQHECPKCGRVIGWMVNFNKHVKTCNPTS